MDQLKNLNLLFLEDNEEFAKNTTEFLNIYFKKAFHCIDIKSAMNIFNEYKIDVIISDVKVESENGLDFISLVREKNANIPIVVLSAYKDEDFLFKAIGLNILSYELKPLRYDDFILLLEKISFKFTRADTVILAKNLSYNFLSKELSLNNNPIQLTKKEILFIELLINNSKKITTNEMLQRDIWENKIMSDAGIKNLIFRLRKKVEIDFITSIKGVGYKLSPLEY